MSWGESDHLSTKQTWPKYERFTIHTDFWLSSMYTCQNKVGKDREKHVTVGPVSGITKSFFINLTAILIDKFCLSTFQRCPLEPIEPIHQSFLRLQRASQLPPASNRHVATVIEGHVNGIYTYLILNYKAIPYVEIHLDFI